MTYRYLGGEDLNPVSDFFSFPYEGHFELFNFFRGTEIFGGIFLSGDFDLREDGMVLTYFYKLLFTMAGGNLFIKLKLKKD